MGKKRIITQEGTSPEDIASKASKSSRGGTPKKKIISGTLHVEATFNNTNVCFSDKTGAVLFASSAGALGFKGAKKGTPFAASKVGDIIGEKAKNLGIKDANVVIKGAGSGREPTVRAFLSHGIEITEIRDETPIPHNGPKPKKPRRV